MTGTGTQADPYVVDNWYDFKRAIAIYGVYVKCADGGGTFDMNKYYRYGMAETIYVHAVVDGNGWNIKNLYVLNCVAFCVYGKIENLNFIDLNVLCTNSTARLLRFAHYSNDPPPDNKINCWIKRCVLTGRVSGVYNSQNYAALTDGGSDYVCCPSIIECTLKLKVSGGISMNATAHLVCSSCILDIDSSENDTNYPFYMMHFRNCLIRGTFQKEVKFTAQYHKYNILDIECPSVSGATKAEFFIGNSDKSSYDTSNFYTATSDQLKNTEYLFSLGFPIGNGEMNAITVSDFVQGAFNWQGNEVSSTTNIRSGSITIEPTALTFDYDNFVAEIRYKNASGKYIRVPDTSDTNYTGYTYLMTNYPDISEVYIALRYLNSTAISPPQSCVLYNGFPWTIDSERNDGLPFPVFAPEPLALGAFANATNLVEVSIPRSVKKIGRESFKHTQLTSVTIASDCTYYPTSFPQGCTINFYPD